MSQSRATIVFAVGSIVFGLWLALRRWDLLTPFDISIMAAQALVPLLLFTLCSIALLRRRNSARSSLVCVGLVVLMAYPIWILSWWLSMSAVIGLVRLGANPDVLTNSQAFLSSFVEQVYPAISIAGAMAMAAWISATRVRSRKISSARAE